MNITNDKIGNCQLQGKTIIRNYLCHSSLQTLKLRAELVATINQLAGKAN